MDFSFLTDRFSVHFSMHFFSPLIWTILISSNMHSLCKWWASLCRTQHFHAHLSPSPFLILAMEAQLGLLALTWMLWREQDGKEVSLWVRSSGQALSFIFDGSFRVQLHHHSSAKSVLPHVTDAKGRVLVERRTRSSISLLVSSLYPPPPSVCTWLSILGEKKYCQEISIHFFHSLAPFNDRFFCKNSEFVWLQTGRISQINFYDRHCVMLIIQFGCCNRSSLFWATMIFWSWNGSDWISVWDSSLAIPPASVSKSNME